MPGEIGEEGNRALEDAEKDGTPPRSRGDLGSEARPPDERSSRGRRLQRVSSWVAPEQFRQQLSESLVEVVDEGVRSGGSGLPVKMPPAAFSRG